MSVAAWLWTVDAPAEFWPLMATGWYGESAQTPPWWAFWFISVLFFVTLLRRWLEFFPAWVAWAVAAGGLLLAMLPDSLLGRTPLGIGLALPCLFSSCLGPARCSATHSIPVTRYRALEPEQAIFLLGLLAVWLGVEEPLNIKFAGFGQFPLSPVVGAAMAAGLVLVFGAGGGAPASGRPRRSTPWFAPGPWSCSSTGWLLQTLVDHDVLDDAAKFAPCAWSSAGPWGCSSTPRPCPLAVRCPGPELVDPLAGPPRPARGPASRRPAK